MTKKLNQVLAVVLTIVALVTGQTAWAESTWKVTNNNGNSNTFTIKRSETGYVQKVLYRTISLSAYAGQHFTEAYGVLEFKANEDEKTVTVNELTPDDAYAYQNGTSRKYGFEVTDRAGFRLDYAERSKTWGTSVPSSAIFGVKSINVGSGETTASDAGYINNPYRTMAGSDYYDNAAPKTWLTAIGATLHMTLSMKVKEVNDGYQYIQVLFDNTSSCDDRSKCSDGNPGNINLSRYMAGFGHHPGSYDGNWSTYTFPVTSQGNNCGTVSNPWGNTIDAKLYDQKFKENSYRDNNGKLIIPTEFTTLVLRLNASGDNQDSWTCTDVTAHIQAVDNTNPTMSAVSVNPGRHAKGNTFYVSVAFSEIVNYTGTKKLNTNWGELSYVTGSGTNVLTFSGIIPQDATENLSVSSISGTIQDLAGKSLSGGVTASNLCPVDADFAYILSDFKTDGSGNYLIQTHDDLNGLAGYINKGEANQGKTFLQVADIAFPHTTNWNNASSTENNYTAIGINTKYFKGIFDGQGHTISGIRIYKGNNNNQGLFGYISGNNAVVRNVHLADSRITGKNEVAGIVGFNAGGTVEDCTVAADVCIHTTENSSEYHGGIVGYNSSNYAVTQRCISRATLTVANGLTGCNRYGGIVGSNMNGTINDCLALGAVIPDVDKRGTIVGSCLSGLVRNYYRQCTVAGVENATGVGNGYPGNSNPEPSDITDNQGACALYAVTLGTNVTINRTPATDPLPGTNNYTYDNGADIAGVPYGYEGATLTLGYSGEIGTGHHVEYSATAGTISGNELTMPAEAVTVSATVPANTYTIRFHKNNDAATGTMVDQVFTYDEAQNLTACTFSHSGEALAAWTTNADGTGTKYTDGQEVSNLTAENGAVIELYAQWQHDWSFPTWTVANDYTTATAHFTCALCGETEDVVANCKKLSDDPKEYSVMHGFEEDGFPCSFHYYAGSDVLNPGLNQTLPTHHAYYLCGISGQMNGTYRIWSEDAYSVIYYALRDDGGINDTNQGHAYDFNVVTGNHNDLDGNLDYFHDADDTTYGIVFGAKNGGESVTVNVKGVMPHTYAVADGIVGGTVSITPRKTPSAYYSTYHKAYEDDIVWLTFTPDEPLTGKAVVWTVTDAKGQDVPVQYHEGNPYFVMPAISVTVSAKVLPVVSYIDADGNEQSHTCTRIEFGTTTYGNSANTEAWYYVEGDVYYNENDKLIFNDQQVNIILCDGARLTHNSIGSKTFIDVCNGSLAIYGQSGGTGSINCKKQTRCIDVMYNIDFNGGKVTAISGTYANNGNITIRRGSVYASGLYSTSGTITLGCATAADRITASSYSGTVVVATGQTLTDGTALYIGTLNSDQVGALAGQTLRPAIPYIDENGDEQLCKNYTVLDDTMTELSPGTYVVTGNVDYTSTVTLGDDVTLILTDGCTMNIGSSSNRISGTGINGSGLKLTIYGQSNQTGKLNVYTHPSSSGASIYVKKYAQHGGNVNPDANGGYALQSSTTITGGTLYAKGKNRGDLTVSGGTVNITGNIEGDVTFSGGNLTIGGNIIGNTNLSWTSATDRIKANRYDGTVVVATGQTLTDGTALYSGTLNSDQVGALAGKTLQPCFSITLPAYVVATGVISQDGTTAYALPAATITLSPETGFTLADVQMNGNATTDNGDGTWSFQMPAANATVTATFTSGYCGIASVNSGHNVIWTYNPITTTLTISPNPEAVAGGETDFRMYNYGSNNRPWKDYKDALTTIVIDAGVTSIGTYAFEECSSLTAITIPDGVTSIGHDAFYDCHLLESITIPASVTSIGENVFENCDNLATIIVLPVTPPTIGTDNLGTYIGSNASGKIIYFRNPAYMENAGWNIVVYNNEYTLGFALVDNGENDIAALNDGNTHNIMLNGRTLSKSGEWNTLCLPFSLGNAEADDGHHFDGTPLEGAIIKELNTSESNLAANGTMTLSFTNATSIVAGMPYIVKWAKAADYDIADPETRDVKNPVFNYVKVTSTTPTAVTFANNANAGGNCQFVGQYSPFTIDNSNINSVIMLSTGNKLGYSKNPRQLKCFRAHFYVPTVAGAPAMNSFVINFGEGETTSLREISNEELEISNDNYYTLDGRKLEGKPTKKGMYIVNGKKVVLH